jgi:HK97 gp10 family phage protein
MATRVRVSRTAGQDIRAAAHLPVRRVAGAIATDMRRYVPVDTGRLRETIRVEDAGPAHFQVWFGDVAAGVDYHLYQEYGTSKMAAQPYARPAAYQERDLT